MIVYLLTNSVNGKKYVGKTTKTLSRRWMMHNVDARRGKQQPLYRAIRKYGALTFRMIILALCSTQSEANELEKAYIIKFRTHVSDSRGYNATWGGDGTEAGERHPWYGKHHSLIARKKISIAKRGKKNPSYKARGSKHWNSGLIRSEETKEKIRKSLTLYRSSL